MPNLENILAEVPASDRPRERLMQYGAKSLSDQELLAILLRTGSRGMNVMYLAAHILAHFESLFDLKQATLEEIQSIHGIGQIKAIELHAVIELGCRINRAEQLKQGTVSSSQRLGKLMIEEMRELQQEHLIALYLNTKNEVIKKKTVFVGSLNQSIAHPREIFQGAVRCSAARIILVHNHPSGNPTPSQNDLVFTKRMQECGDLMGIALLDHLVIGEKDYVSLKEENYI